MIVDGYFSVKMKGVLNWKLKLEGEIYATIVC